MARSRGKKTPERSRIIWGMKTLQVVRTHGDVVQAVELRGDPWYPEPETFRVALPFSDVDVVRCTDGSYWIHVRVDSEQQVREEAAERAGAILEAWIDAHGKHAGDCSPGDIGHPDAYHVAIRVGPKSALARPRG